MWDRFRDRAFYLSQQAVRNVREQADAVLYLVNASEAPEDAGYLAPEMAVLDWIGKPVIVLLNQTGRPRPRDEEQADEARWRSALGSHPTIREVRTLDAFARCWVQEIALFDLVRDALPDARRAPFGRLADAWQARRLAQFDEAMAALAAPIAYAACDREPLPDAAVGVPDRDYGQEILACVVVKPDRTLTRDELDLHCLRELGRYKSPRYVRFVDALPKGPSGKVQRMKLAEGFTP